MASESGALYAGTMDHDVRLSHSAFRPDQQRRCPGRVTPRVGLFSAISATVITITRIEAQA